MPWNKFRRILDSGIPLQSGLDEIAQLPENTYEHADNNSMLK